MTARMKKTSVYLEPDDDYGLERAARVQGISKAEVIRRALHAVARKYPQPRITAIGVGRGPGDLSENLDKYLAEGFGRD